MEKVQTQNKLSVIDRLLDQGGVNTEDLNQRMYLMKSLNDLNDIEAMEAAQKAKVRWSIEGDENSKYFHGILNKKRYQLSIRGVLVDGKNAFNSHFANRLDKNHHFRLKLSSQFPKVLSKDQVEELEREVSYEEVKKAVWDCGENKYPGPDGYTFEFFRRFLNFLDQDIFEAVKCFISTGSFPRGCNSSFITLISKVHDAKLVKDFWPITLIRSVYKIISKLLANSLCYVILDLISDIQSAFVTNRQILDRPFILNELISWCKSKKFKAMIFKVDFEKAYDSVRWDYLDDILYNFGFGDRWRMWIKGCLKSSMGSVLINGSPSSEFQFFKGLKQGDPLSPFLFILVMESLHISFSRVMQAGLFLGISINESLHLSHLFYADDAVFVGDWNDSNLATIVHVLKCFFSLRVSRLICTKVS
ncbi:RNA-directed DNA polymerase, eukaryota [Tanacetum coccineum]